jgi:hypothetical protein
MQVVTGYDEIDMLVGKGAIIAFEASSWEGPMFLSKPIISEDKKFKVINKYIDVRRGPPLGSMWNNVPGPMEHLTMYRVRNIVTKKTRKFTTNQGWEFSISQVILL